MENTIFISAAVSACLLSVPASAQSFTFDQADITLGYSSMDFSLSSIFGGAVDLDPITSTYIRGRAAFNVGSNFGLQFGAEYQKLATDVNTIFLPLPVEVGMPAFALDAHAYYRAPNWRAGLYVSHQMPGAITATIGGIGLALDPDVDITTYGIEGIYEHNKYTFEARYGKAKFSDANILGFVIPVSNFVDADMVYFGMDYALNPKWKLNGGINHISFDIVGNSVKNTTLTVGAEYYTDFGGKVPMKFAGFIGNSHTSGLGFSESSMVVGINASILFGGKSKGSDRKRMFSRTSMF